MHECMIVYAMLYHFQDIQSFITPRNFKQHDKRDKRWEEILIAIDLIKNIIHMIQW